MRMMILKRSLANCLVVSLLTGLLMCTNVHTPSAWATGQSLNFADVEQFLDGVMQNLMEEFNIPNATLSVVANGEVLMAKGYGYADLSERKTVDEERSLFRVGSLAKLFTWTAVMQLVEQGKLDLNTDVNEYLDFEIPSELVYAQGDSGVITLKHLMAHTPGFEDSPSGLYRLSEDQKISLEEYVRDDLPARIYPAGEVMAYSNYGSALAGYIVQQVSGMPFEEYVENHIFSPLGMNNSTFRQPLPAELAPNMARAYRYIDGEYVEGKFEFLPGPAGGISTTAMDMVPFMLAFLNGGQYEGKRILEESTVEQMLSPLFSHHPQLHGMAHGFMEGTFNGQRTLFHSGSTMVFDAGLYLLPEEQVGIFMAHSGGSSFLGPMELFQAFMDRYYPANDVDSLVPPAGMLERSEAFVGEYQQNRRVVTTLEKFLNLVSMLIHVDVDDEGYLLVTHLGETNRFIEVEPGVYRNLREGRSQDPTGDFRTIVFGTDPLGKTMLMTDSPLTYSKAAWYESSMFNMQMMAMVLLFFVASLFYWGIKAIVQRIRRRKSESSIGELVAKGLAISFGLVTVVFIVGFLVTVAPDPVYQLPAVAYGEIPAISPFLDLLPIVSALIAGAIAIFFVLAWWKKYWKLPGRIHFTLYTAATLFVIWFFRFWNML